MPRLRKLRRKQKFQYNVNRRRLHKKQTKLPRINCDAVREAWDEKKSLSDNLTAMGLIADPNSHHEFRIPSVKEQIGGTASTSSKRNEELPDKTHVVDSLQKEAIEGYQKKKETAHPLPPEMFKKLCKLIDKYGEDYEGMAKDHTNYYQETASQFKKQVERLKKIPQQWIPYLRSRDMLSENI